MLQSLRLSNLVIRLGLAAVFLWFGIDKFLHPDYWISAWVPQSVLALINHIGMSASDFIFLNGIFEILLAVSLMSNLLTKYFAFAGILFLLGIQAFFFGTEIAVRDIAMIGGFLALVFWPDRRYP